jgi:glycosyltransferase involved in cell wall biosynthesis
MVTTLYGWPQGLQFKPIDMIHSKNNIPRLSIVIPTLNQGETIEHTLLSIIHQDYTNFEIIVVDGGSSDNTYEIISKYQAWISYYISGQDSGQSNALNIGFRLATGDIYAWINSDDYYLPLAFSRVSKIFLSNKDVNLVVGAGDVITKDCKFLKHISPMLMNSNNVIKWLNGEWIMQQSCFWSSDLWHRTGGVDESLKLLMDFDLWFKFSKYARSYILNESLAVMRYYPEIKTVSLKDYVTMEAAYVFAKNGKFQEVKKLVYDLSRQYKDLSITYQNEHNRLINKIARKIQIRK